MSLEIMGLLLLALLVLLGAIASSALLGKSVSGFDGFPTALRVGLSYMVGYAAVALALAATSKIVDFRTATLSLLLALVAVDVGLWWRYRVRNSHGARRLRIGTASTLLAFSGAILAAMPAVMLFWTRAGVDPTSPWSFVGSLHSVRYAWISNFISVCGDVPVLGQNFAQSILAGVPASVGTQMPYIALTALLASALVGLVFVTYGLLKCRGVGWLARAIGTFVVLAGGSALSLTHVLTIDSGLPFALNGYPDTLVGLGLVVVFLLVFSPSNSVSTGSIARLAAQTVVVAGLAFFAAPSLLLLVALALIWILADRSGLQSPRKKILEPGLALGLGLLIALPLGGMLTPELLRSNLDYSGLMTAGGISELRFLPEIPFYLPGGQEWAPGWTTDPTSSILGSNESLSLGQVLWSVEELAWRGLRLLLWPVLGSLFLLERLRRRGRNGNRQESFLEAHTPAWSALILLGLGSIVTFAFSLGPLKWEMARFLLPGMYLGLLGLAVGISTALARDAWRSRLLGSFLAILVVAGPVLNTADTARSRLAAVTSVEGQYALTVWSGAGPQQIRDLCPAP